MLHAELPPADTILIVDALHYLPPGDQDEVLARAAAALRPRGRLVVRETDADAPGPGRFLRLVERLVVRAGYNRGEQLFFRPATALERTLTDLGLVFEPSRAQTPVSANVLIVARLPD